MIWIPGLLVSSPLDVQQHRIDDYYQAERENEQIQKTGSKLPTPDAVICNKPADTVITALKTQKVDYDEKNFNIIFFDLGLLGVFFWEKVGRVI